MIIVKPKMFRLLQFAKVQEYAFSTDIKTMNLTFNYNNPDSFIQNLILFKDKIFQLQSVSIMQVKLNDRKMLENILLDLHNYSSITYSVLSNNSYKPLEDNIIDNIKLVQEEGLELFKKKNKDYGDAFANYGIIGILVRIGDKLARLESLHKNKTTAVISESILDTIIDLYNYSTMAIMLLDDLDRDLDNKIVDDESDVIHVAPSLQELYNEKVIEFNMQSIIHNKLLKECDELMNMITSTCDHKWIRDISVYCDSTTPHICTNCGLTD